MRCPNCGYMRKTDELAPEWQCPSCQVAYAKTTPHRSLNRAQLPRGITAGAGGVSQGIGIVIVAILIAGIAYFGYSFARGNPVFNSFGVSVRNNQELIANKKAELAAYEQGLQQVEEQITQARASVGTCAITGQPNQFILTQDPRPELQAKISQLKEEIRRLENKS